MGFRYANNSLRNAAATLTEFAANPRWLGGTGAFTLVLHTWTQDLRRHLHVHALMACGALQPAGHGDADDAWTRPKRSRTFLFPAHALSKVFRGKFMQAPPQAGDSGALPRDPADTATAACAACRPSRSIAVRIASSDAGAWSSIAAPTTWPLLRRCSPHAEARRDAHVRPHAPRMACAHARARSIVRPPRRNGTPDGTSSRPYRRRLAFVAGLRPQPDLDIQFGVRRHCRHRALKPTLPIATATPAVKFNTVYLTPRATAHSFSIVPASDKRYSLDHQNHEEPA